MSTALLVLEDGTTFQGQAVGAAGECLGEVVFNTAMTGYQEILTDPSYKGQIVTMTYPHIGNYGANPEDVESAKPWAEGLIVRELSAIASNHRATESLPSYLERHRIVAIAGIDTRAITERLRVRGALKGGISTLDADPESVLRKVRAAPEMTGQDLVPEVTCKEAYDWPIEGQGAGDGGRGSPRPTSHAPRPFKVVVVDCGVKYNILRCLDEASCRVSVVPARTSPEEIMMYKPDGLVFSNGPGDPAAVTYVVATAKKLLGRLPIFGICLGHQILGLALGGKTYKLKFGHHGANHPVMDVQTQRVHITSQNHGFAVDLESMPDKRVQLTHLNLNDQTVEGFCQPEKQVYAVQYHPEASPGPHDANYLFTEFVKTMERNRPTGSTGKTGPTEHA